MSTPLQASAYYRAKLTRLWKESPMIHAARARCRIAVGLLKCEKCGDVINHKLIEVDHIKPKMAPGQDPLDIALFAARLNCPAEGLQCLCEPCHNGKTTSENKLRRKGA